MNDKFHLTKLKNNLPLSWIWIQQILWGLTFLRGCTRIINPFMWSFLKKKIRQSLHSKMSLIWSRTKIILFNTWWQDSHRVLARKSHFLVSFTFFFFRAAAAFPASFNSKIWSAELPYLPLFICKLCDYIPKHCQQAALHPSFYL